MKARFVAGALALFCALGCGERTSSTLGIAMGADTELRPVIEERIKRLNDSAGTRAQLQLMFEPPEASMTSDRVLRWAHELAKEPSLIGVVGHESSRSALLAAPVYAQRGVVQLVPTGTSARLANITPWTFALVASDSSQGDLIARQLIATHTRYITLFVQDDEYGRGIVEALKHAIVGHDIEILDNVVQTQDSDYGLLVRSVLNRSPVPDALVLITQGSIALHVAKLAWAQRSSLLIIGADAANTTAEQLRAAAPAADRLALVTYWFPDTTEAATKQFLRDFQKHRPPQGVPQWNHAALYDAVGLLATATREAGSNPKAIRRWLQSLGRSHNAYQGVLGAIDFTGQHAIPARMIRPTLNGWQLIP
jgi:ABC-type branched-subunit amino acid transport system substrate-binding protein